MADLVNLVTVKIDPEIRETFLEILLANAASARQEEGCFYFDIVASEDDENSFIFYEIYRDKAALDAHRETPHFKRYFAYVQEMGDKVERSAKIYYMLDKHA